MSVLVYLKYFAISPWSILSPLDNLETSTTNTPSYASRSTFANNICICSRSLIVSPLTTSS